MNGALVVAGLFFAVAALGFVVSLTLHESGGIRVVTVPATLTPTPTPTPDPLPVSRYYWASEATASDFVAGSFDLGLRASPGSEERWGCRTVSFSISIRAYGPGTTHGALPEAARAGDALNTWGWDRLAIAVPSGQQILGIRLSGSGPQRDFAQDPCEMDAVWDGVDSLTIDGADYKVRHWTNGAADPCPPGPDQRHNINLFTKCSRLSSVVVGLAPLPP